jgi:hypothetical protein
MPRGPTWRVAAFAAAMTACTTAASPDAAPNDASLATDALDSPDVAESGLDAIVIPTTCTEGADARTPGVSCVREVRGTVLDESGAPLAGVLVTVCGFDCFFSHTDSTGTFIATPGSLLPTAHYAIIVHGRPDHASLMIPLPVPVDGIVELARPIYAPRYTDVGDFVPSAMTGGTATAGDVTTTFAAGTTLLENVEDADLGDLGRRVRTVTVPAAQAPPFAQGLVAMYSLAPFDLISTLPIGLSIANRTSLAPGTAVDFVAMGDEVFLDPFTGGLPIVAAHGHVSTDGRTIATDPGQGVSYLTWIGIRASGG